MAFLFVLLLASAISYILPHTFVDRVCCSFFHTQYNFRDISEIIVQRYLLCLIACKVEALITSASMVRKMERLKNIIIILLLMSLAMYLTQ